MHKYLKPGTDQLAFDGPLKVIDCHCHLSAALPARDKTTEASAPPTYPTVPSEAHRDFTVPYWHDPDFLKWKYTGFGALFRFAAEGVRIYKDIMRSGSIENALAYQKANYVVRSVVLPISTAKCDCSPEALDIAKRYPGDFIPFCSVHPGDSEALSKFERYVTEGARGMKLKMTGADIDRHFDVLVKMLTRAAALELPVLFHTGAIDVEAYGIKGKVAELLTSTKVSCFEKLLAAAPENLKFIFGHSGIHEYERVAALLEQYPATYAELSCQSESSIRALIEKVGAHRLLFGSDWPALPPAVTLANVLAATEGDEEARKQIVYDNAAALFGLD